MRYRLHLNIRGRVQGTNLRSMIKLKALEGRINGYVKNLPDGCVEVKMEGEKERLEDFIQWLKSSPGFSEIRALDESWKTQENKGEFSDFSIIY